MFIDYKHVLNEHFEQLTNQCAIMWVELILKLRNQILKFWPIGNQCFNCYIMNQQQKYNGILFYGQFHSQLRKVYSPRNHEDKLIKFYDHLEYTYVAQLIIEMMNTHMNQYQQSFIIKSIQEFEQLTKLHAINFTQILHELFTKTKNKDLEDFLITSQILIKMFEVIQSNNKIVGKNAAYIISLISNYYSNELLKFRFKKRQIRTYYFLVSFHYFLQNYYKLFLYYQQYNQGSL